ncbi:MAG: hypothetical protein WD473_11995 [Acidimicrobiia bacterium]
MDIEAARAVLNVKADKIRARLVTAKAEAPGRDALVVHEAVKAKKPPESVKFDDLSERLESELAQLTRARKGLDSLSTGLLARITATTYSDDFSRYLDRVWAKAIKPATPKPSDRWDSVQAYDARATELVELIQPFVLGNAREIGIDRPETSALLKAIQERPEVMPTIDRLRAEWRRPREAKEEVARLAAEAKREEDKAFAIEEAKLRSDFYNLSKDEAEVSE